MEDEIPIKYIEIYIVWYAMEFWLFSFKYLVKSFFITKLSSKVSKIKTTILTVTLKNQWIKISSRHPNEIPFYQEDLKPHSIMKGQKANQEEKNIKDTSIDFSNKFSEKPPA